MTAHQSEEEDNSRLRKAKQAVEYCRNLEIEARAALSRAVDSTKSAKEKYEALFAQCEARAVARRKSGQIIVNPGY